MGMFAQRDPIPSYCWLQCLCPFTELKGREVAIIHSALCFSLHGIFSCGKTKSRNDGWMDRQILHAYLWLNHDLLCIFMHYIASSMNICI